MMVNLARVIDLKCDSVIGRPSQPFVCQVGFSLGLKAFLSRPANRGVIQSFRPAELVGPQEGVSLKALDQNLPHVPLNPSALVLRESVLSVCARRVHSIIHTVLPKV